MWYIVGSSDMNLLHMVAEVRGSDTFISLRHGGVGQGLPECRLLVRLNALSSFTYSRLLLGMVAVGFDSLLASCFASGGVAFIKVKRVAPWCMSVYPS